MNQVFTEKFIDKLGVEVYPITIIKFLLNRKRILLYFARANSKTFELRGNKYLLDNSECEVCNSRKPENIMCRQHTSIYRVLNGDNVGFDKDTGTYFYMNEIFKMVGNRLVIVYCPHPKLINMIGKELTDEAVRKVNPVTIEDPNLKMKVYSKVVNFSSNDLMESNMRCWFNDTFSLVTIPEDRNFSNWCLVLNQ
jgi:hypothetical protein